MRLDVHVNQGLTPWGLLEESALAAEEAGFGTFWVLDHLTGGVVTAPTMREAFTVLGALAVRTSTISIGPLVANVVNRHPALLAAAAATVSDLSGGRLELGLGAGTSPTSRWATEHHDLGIGLAPALADRHARFAEVVDELRRLWSAEHGPDGFPRPVVPPPMIVGVNSVALATIAGQRCDGCNVFVGHPQRAAVLRAGREARSLAHGADAPWTSSVWTFWEDGIDDPEHPLRVELASEGVDRLVLLWRREPDPDAIARARVRSV